MGKKAGDETRTRDIQLGKLVLYQLSYARKACVPLQYRGGGGDCKNDEGSFRRVFVAKP